MIDKKTVADTIREHPIYRLSPSEVVLAKQASLCCRANIPKSYSEMGELLWQAFWLGTEYRDTGGTDQKKEAL